MVDFQTREWVKGQKLLADDLNDQERRIGNAFALAGTGNGDGGGGVIEVPAFGDPVGQADKGWVPVFGDDFDGEMQVENAAAGIVRFGSGPEWRTRIGGATPPNGGRTLDTSPTWFDASQVSQKDSSVFLKTTYSPDATNRPNNPYLTGMLQPADFTQTHGYIEARVKNPYLAGTLKLIGAVTKDMASPRVDFLRQYGDLGDIKVSTYKNDQPGVTNSLSDQYVGWSKDWIVVGLEWTESTLIFYIDGVEVTRDTNREGIPDRPMATVIASLIDSNATGVDSTKFPISMELDYVRQWQRIEDKTLLLEDKFTSLNNWRVDKGTMTMTGNGEATIDGVAGQWQNGSSVFLQGVPAGRDFDMYFDIRMPNVESYTSLAFRADGTLSGGAPPAVYAMVWAPQNGKWTLERFDYNGSTSIVFGEKAYNYGDQNTWHRGRVWLDGGQMKAKLWRRGTDEPEAWDISWIMGKDKSADYVFLQEGKILLSSLNGNSGEARQLGIGNVKVTKAAIDDPVWLMKDEDTAPPAEEKPTAYGAYTLGGATGTGLYQTELLSVRYPVMLPKKAKRLRVHVVNRQSLDDYNLDNGPKIVEASFGMKKPGNSQSELALVSATKFTGSTGSLDNGGEWVSDWMEPDFDTRNFAWLTLAIQMANTYVAVTYSGYAFHRPAGNFVTETAGQNWTNRGGTPFNAYVEYEYEEDGSKYVLFIGDSIPEGYVDGGKAGPGDGNMRNWKGHMTSFPETYGHHTGNIAVLNAYASARIDHWRSQSTKWNRFDGMVEPIKPDAVVIHLGGNDLFQNQKWYDIVPEMEALLQEIKDRYPYARRMVMGMMPLLATFSTPGSTTPFQDRTNLNSGYSSISRDIMHGYIDPNNGIYDPASGSNENVQPKYCSFDGLHLAPAAYELLAAAIQV